MKKTILLALALAMVPVALSAQAKKKTAAELAAERKAALDKAAADKRAATEQAVKDREAALQKKGEDAQNSALAAADKTLSSLSLMAWGGYNFTVKNDLQKNDTSSTYGGPSGGFHGYYGSKLQLGLSAGYITYMNTQAVAATATTSGFPATTVSIIPVEARVRYILGDMFFVGAFAGYGAYLANPENTAGKPSFITSGLYAGVNYAVSSDLSIALFCDARYLGSLNTELNNSVAKGNVLITPAIGAYFKF